MTACLFRFTCFLFPPLFLFLPSLFHWPSCAHRQTHGAKSWTVEGLLQQTMSQANSGINLLDFRAHGRGINISLLSGFCSKTIRIRTEISIAITMFQKYGHVSDNLANKKQKIELYLTGFASCHRPMHIPTQTQFHYKQEAWVHL